MPWPLTCKSAANVPMSDQTRSLGDVAKGLARNPLGIIALFIGLVYGFASLVTVFASSFTATERLPLIYFLVFFPILVLGVFAWLVSRHSGKLFAPSDFRNEENYVKMQLSAVASLAVATAKRQEPASESAIQRIVEVVRDAAAPKGISSDGWRSHVLWVDDRPDGSIYERQAFEAMGLRFTLSVSTNEAIEHLSKQRFAAIISDMGRREGQREGYVLLDALRHGGNQTPFFIYASSDAPEHKLEILAHGGQGSTNNAHELFQMVTKVVLSGS